MHGDAEVIRPAAHLAVLRVFLLGPSGGVDKGVVDLEAKHADKRCFYFHVLKIRFCPVTGNLQV